MRGVITAILAIAMLTVSTFATTVFAETKAATGQDYSVLDGVPKERMSAKDMANTEGKSYPYYYPYYSYCPYYSYYPYYSKYPAYPPYYH